jgi:hypothetical protein
MKTGWKSVFHPPYSSLVRYYGVVHNFFEVAKKVVFRLKTQRGSSLVLPKNVCSQRKWTKYPYFIPHEAHIHVVHKFLGAPKNIEFRLKTQIGYPSVSLKNIYSQRKLARNPYFNTGRPIFHLG